MLATQRRSLYFAAYPGLFGKVLRLRKLDFIADLHLSAQALQRIAMTLAHAALLFGMSRSTAPLSSWVSLLSNLNAPTMFNGPTSLQGAVDIVCSVDSVITAVGMVEELGVMIAAVVIAVAIMMVSAEAVSGFVNSHPTLKMLTLSFLLLIGF